MNRLPLIWADVVPQLPDALQQATYRLAAVEAYDDRQWFLPLVVGVCCLLVLFVSWMYRRDGVALQRGTRWSLVLLRCAALAVALLYFFDLQKRGEREVMHNSRVAVLIDTSLSMGLADADAAGGSAGTRIGQVAGELKQGTLLQQLRQVHDVSILRFDEAGRPQEVASLPKQTAKSADAAAPLSRAELQQWTRFYGNVAAGLLVGAAVAGIAALVLRRADSSIAGWGLLLSVGLLLSSATTLAFADLRQPAVSLWVKLGIAEPVSPVDVPVEESAEESADGQAAEESDEAAPAASKESKDGSPEAADWESALQVTGTETRIGEALRRVVDDQRAAPLAGVILISDGQQNAGIEPASAVRSAREARIPIYTVGLGSASRPANVRVADLLAPSRAYPGDAFTITGFIKSVGMQGRRATVELLIGQGDAAQDGGKLVESRRIELVEDHEAAPVKFEIKSDEAGRHTYTLRISETEDDQNDADNQQQADVELVDRKNRVLLVASAATREYRFLRNQLRRDKDVIVDVLLQTALPGISQDANDILDAFPATKEELFAYDAMVAFDANWDALSTEQLDLVEAWIAEQAGGLILVAGPIHTDVWSRSERCRKIRDVLPVEFRRRLASLRDAAYGSTSPMPLKFTREGSAAEFLWLADSRIQSDAAWASFPGVYGFYNVQGAKPGATVYVRLDEVPSTLGQTEAVYLAGHFYGSGRVLYLGSGEMWRLRALDDAYFEKFYTKAVRHVSEGRLMRGSERGVLLVERDRYLLGATVVVRAQLSDAQHEPLEVSGVPLQLTRPDRTTEMLNLQPDAARGGMYLGQFPAVQEGSYRLDLPVPESGGEVISRRINVQVPDLERETPQRNDALLSEIAQGSGGEYYVGLPAAVTGGSVPAVAKRLPDRTEVTTLTGAPDADFERRLMMWVLALACGTLSLEWLIRRLSKLA